MPATDATHRANFVQETLAEWVTPKISLMCADNTLGNKAQLGTAETGKLHPADRIGPS